MIELKNIHKYYKKHHVLKGIDLNVNKGDVLVIIGPSGSGKTTLLRCMNYLEQPDEGTIAIDGFQIGAKASRKEILTLRRKTAMVFQHYNLFKNKTVLENVMEGLIVAQKKPVKEAKETSLNYLEKVGLLEKIDS